MGQTDIGQKLVTAEELLAMPDDGMRRELIAGEVVAMTPGGDEHGALASEIMGPLQVWVKEHRLGRVHTVDTGFILSRDPDTVRAPDGAFTTQGRLQPRSKSFSEVVPDLVLEVVSPNDHMAEILRKVAAWLDAGVRVVWVLWPDARRISIFRNGDDVEVREENETLTCEELLPGFALPLSEIFE